MIGAFLWGVLTGIAVVLLAAAASLRWSLAVIQRHAERQLFNNLTAIVSRDHDEQG